MCRKILWKVKENFELIIRIFCKNFKQKYSEDFELVQKSWELIRKALVKVQRNEDKILCKLRENFGKFRKCLNKFWGTF